MEGSREGADRLSVLAGKGLSALQGGGCPESCCPPISNHPFPLCHSLITTSPSAILPLAIMSPNMCVSFIAYQHPNPLHLLPLPPLDVRPPHAPLPPSLQLIPPLPPPALPPPLSSSSPPLPASG